MIDIKSLLLHTISPSDLEGFAETEQSMMEEPGVKDAVKRQKGLEAAAHFQQAERIEMLLKQSHTMAVAVMTMAREEGISLQKVLDGKLAGIVGPTSKRAAEIAAKHLLVGAIRSKIRDSVGAKLFPTAIQSFCLNPPDYLRTLPLQLTNAFEMIDQ